MMHPEHENTSYWVGWSPPNNRHEGKTLRASHRTAWRGRAMKKAGIFLPAFFMLNVSIGIGQVYFDNLYGDPLSADGIPTGGAIAISNGYLILSTRYNGQDDHYGFVVNTTGSFDFGFELENSDTTSEFGGTIVRYNDTTLVGMAQWSNLNQPSDERGDIMLSGFSEGGIVFWRKRFGAIQMGEFPGNVVMTNDGGFGICGQVVRYVGTQADGQVYLLRINAARDSIWEGSYGGNSNEWGSDLLQTPDSGFLLLGWTRS